MKTYASIIRTQNAIRFLSDSRYRGVTGLDIGTGLGYYDQSHFEMCIRDSMSINRVIISGNLTRDPELRSTASGLPVLGFGVAVNDRRKNQQTGEWEDYPNFIDCTMFGARAESLSRYLGKGTKVAIEGKLRWSQWEREGQKRSKIEVSVDELEFMSSRNSDSSSYGGGMGGGYSAPAAAPVVAAPVVDASSSVYDEDIPF